MSKKSFFPLILIVVIVLLFSSCLPGDGQSTPMNPAGFFWGVWHGWMAPISLVLSLINPFLNIYEVHNTGFWYDLAFYAAIIGGFGGLQLSRKKKKRRDD